MEGTNYSLSDIAALVGKGNSEGGWAWLFLIIVLLAVGGRGFGGAGGPAIPPNMATQTDVQAAVNNQSINAGIQQVLLSSANNNYETAQLIGGQSNAFMQQNNANQINMIQGFNSVVQQMTNQTNTLASKLDAVIHHQDECCCTIQRLLMQQQLDEANRKLADAENKNNINQQTQYLMGTMGRWVSWAGNGSAGVADAARAASVA